MASLEGKWDITIESPVGNEKGVLTVTATSGNSFTGTYYFSGNSNPVVDGKVQGEDLSWKVDLTDPVSMTLAFRATVSGNKMTGTAGASGYGTYTLTGTQE
ncbi:MAG TPA: hypothetical protein VIH93_05520 [Thermoanaerobaculia bacterium]|jgi:hypothetical protein